MSPLENTTYEEPYFTKLSTEIRFVVVVVVVVIVLLLLLFRDSSSSESPDSENVYQIPRIDPIYQIPSGLPVVFTQRSETEIEPNKVESY